MSRDGPACRLLAVKQTGERAGPTPADPYAPSEKTSAGETPGRRGTAICYEGTGAGLSSFFHRPSFHLQLENLLVPPTSSRVHYACCLRCALPLLSFFGFFLSLIFNLFFSSLSRSPPFYSSLPTIHPCNEIVLPPFSPRDSHPRRWSVKRSATGEGDPLVCVRSTRVRVKVYRGSPAAPYPAYRPLGAPMPRDGQPKPSLTTRFFLLDRYSVG